MVYILLGVGIFVILIFWGTALGSFNGENSSFSIKIPEKMRQSDFYLTEKKKYTKSVHRIPLFGLLLFLILFIPKDSLQLLYFLMIIMIVLLGMFRSLNMSMKRLVQHKKEFYPEYTSPEEEKEMGFLYRDPTDPRIFVEKRLGIGYTINFGNKKGKVLGWVFNILLIVILVPTLFMLVRLDFTEPEFIVKSTKISIDYPAYHYSFNPQSVQSLELVKDFESVGHRTNGIEGTTYLRGNFSSKVYGKMKLYLYKKNPPYILIRLKGMTLLINEKTPSATEDLYKRLQGVQIP